MVQEVLRVRRMMVARAIARSIAQAIVGTALIMGLPYAAGVGADFGPVNQHHIKVPHIHFKLLT